jgi:hypothetical protein
VNDETDEIKIEEINNDFVMQIEEHTYEEVKKIIKNLKNNESPGPDKIEKELSKQEVQDFGIDYIIY